MKETPRPSRFYAYEPVTAGTVTVHNGEPIDRLHIFEERLERDVAVTDAGLVQISKAEARQIARRVYDARLDQLIRRDVYDIGRAGDGSAAMVAP